MKLSKKIKNIQFLFRPKFWLMNYSFSKYWDRDLNFLIDNASPKLLRGGLENDYYYIVFNDKVKVWIKNYPYAYGRVSDYSLFGGTINMRPSRLTILKLRKLENKLKEEDI